MIDYLKGTMMRKFFVLLVIVFFAVTACALKNSDTRLAVDKHGKTVVERYGNLQVLNNKLCNSSGKPIQLRGMSSHGLQWYGKYANDNVIKWLRDDWNCQIFRAAMYLDEDGYISNSSLKFLVFESIESCIKNGMYVIVDWHVLSDKDPLVHKNRAVEFFSEIAQKYGSYPNIIYEICNEPNGRNVTWENNIKPYAEELIPAIRKYDPDNIIIVGTPTWSQDVDIAAKNPITGQKNIMYSLHFYAGTHGKELRSKASAALKAGIPLFVTEWGTSEASGDGGVFEKETLEWIKFMQKNNISWVNWSINNKGESSGILKQNADKNAEGNWNRFDLSPSGKLVRKILRNEIK